MSDHAIREPTDWTDRYAVRLHSIAEEERTGFDSIPTIESRYDRAATGAFLCPFPNCNFKRHEVVPLWRHVHFSSKHAE